MKEPAFAEKRAKEVLDIVKLGKYQLWQKSPDSGEEFDISEDVQFSIGHTDFVTEAEIGTFKVDTSEKDPKADKYPIVLVTNESTTKALKRFSDQGLTRPLGLNFASPKNPGGGFLRGAQAQEEDLCRSSCLYHTLANKKEFYDYYQFVGPTGTGNLLYSPNVVFFKDENYTNVKPFKASIITCAAPNISGLDKEIRNSATIKTILRDRIGSVLRCASHYGHRNLVLGAWGAGVFGNDPEIVADQFKYWIYDSYTFENCFDNIVFAVLDTTPNQINFSTFQNTFK